MVDLPPDACAALTDGVGEPLTGTASSDGATLFLVRYRGAWPKKAVAESALPDALKARLAAATKATGGRALLVRGPVREPDPPELYVARTLPGERFLLRFRFPSYEAMAELDLVEVAASGAHPDAERLDAPIFLVCTHGKRDACCAARGFEVFHAIEGVRPGRVFQASHVGGHRFAANALSLPDGFCYGRVSPDDAVAWIDATERGAIFDLARVRGRVCFAPAVQAAEVFLRDALAETDVDALALESVEDEGGGRARVVFRAGGTTHEVALAEEPMGVLRPASCGAEPEPATRFVLVSHREYADRA